MKSKRPTSRISPDLAWLIRQSRALDPALKRQWLSILDQLSPSHKARLYEILASELAPQLPPTPPSGPLPTPTGAPPRS